MLPELRDVTALPTSWALTLWDALPVFLSVELAIALGVALVTRRRLRERTWRLTSQFAVGALAYLSLFDVTLALAFALLTAVQAGLSMIASGVRTAPVVPQTPLRALKERGTDIAWSVAKGCLAAAIIKTLVGPVIESGSAVWIVVGIAGGLVTPVPLGISAIPALAVDTSSGLLLAAMLWLGAATARPYIIHRLKRESVAAGAMGDAS